jgi:ribonucleoside-diphosphate reductase beta chain
MGLFDEQLTRKPNLYPWTQNFIDVMWKGFWTPNEFDFRADYGQFKSELTEDEREIVVKTLSAIGQIEIAVKTFWARLGDNLKHPSISDLGYVMANTEVIHNIAYEKLLDILGLQDVFEENLKEPVVKRRVDYLRKYNKKVYDDDRKQYIYSIILFTLFVENVSLFSQFYIILWFKRFRNQLKDTAQQVEYTRNEENLHAQIGIKLINTLREEYPDLFDDELRQRIIEEAREAFYAEKRVIDWIVGDYKEDGLDADLLKQYVAYRINASLSQIGYDDFQFKPKAEDRSKEFKWMNEELFGYNMTDFFYGKDKNYVVNGKSWDEEELF